MHFLTEDDIRARCPQPGCSLRLAPGERLTPSAAEFAAQMRVTLLQDGASAPAASPAPKQSAPKQSAPAPEPCPCPENGAAEDGMTHLDATVMAPKSHPRIVLRGKLDTLLSAVVLTETQFDPKNRLSGFLKTCLADVRGWVLQVLTAEVSGSAPSIPGMGGMDPETLRTVSRDPKRYLGLDHYCPDPALGANAALCNWLRALARETEVAAVQSRLGRPELTGALNRLSSALYVLTLLTLAAEKGMDVTKLKA